MQLAVSRTLLRSGKQVTCPRVHFSGAKEAASVGRGIS
jgi:hypothetical protein